MITLLILIFLVASVTAVVYAVRSRNQLLSTEVVSPEMQQAIAARQEYAQQAAIGAATPTFIRNTTPTEEDEGPSLLATMLAAEALSSLSSNVEVPSLDDTPSTPVDTSDFASGGEFGGGGASSDWSDSSSSSSDLSGSDSSSDFSSSDSSSFDSGSSSDFGGGGSDF